MTESEKQRGKEYKKAQSWKVNCFLGNHVPYNKIKATVLYLRQVEGLFLYKKFNFLFYHASFEKSHITK